MLDGKSLSMKIFTVDYQRKIEVRELMTPINFSHMYIPTYNKLFDLPVPTELLEQNT